MSTGELPPHGDGHRDIAVGKEGRVLRRTHLTDKLFVAFAFDYRDGDFRHLLTQRLGDTFDIVCGRGVDIDDRLRLRAYRDFFQYESAA